MPGSHGALLVGGSLTLPLEGAGQEEGEQSATLSTSCLKSGNICIYNIEMLFGGMLNLGLRVKDLK
jgi:hypothetical protein